MCKSVLRLLFMSYPMSMIYRFLFLARDRTKKKLAMHPHCTTQPTSPPSFMFFVCAILISLKFVTNAHYKNKNKNKKMFFLVQKIDLESRQTEFSSRLWVFRFFFRWTHSSEQTDYWSYFNLALSSIVNVTFFWYQEILFPAFGISVQKSHTDATRRPF